jgi:hypothetical protein
MAIITTIRSYFYSLILIMVQTYNGVVTDELQKSLEQKFFLKVLKGKECEDGKYYIYGIVFNKKI